jgi:excisionase family DNA binding protein
LTNPTLGASRRDTRRSPLPYESAVRLRGPALYKIDDTCAALALGRTKVYELIATGELVSVKLGRRRVVPANAIADYTARLIEAYETEREEADR